MNDGGIGLGAFPFVGCLAGRPPCGDSLQGPSWPASHAPAPAPGGAGGSWWGNEGGYFVRAKREVARAPKTRVIATDQIRLSMTQ